MHFNPNYSIDSIEYIQEILETRNITPDELSLKTNIDKGTLLKILAREIEISYGYSFLIAEALGVEHDIFVNLDLEHRKKKYKNK